MKYLRRKIYSTEIKPAEDSGTTYYRVTEDQLLDYAENSRNVVFRYLIEKYSFDALDLESKMFGSRLIDNVLYICDTDKQKIQVDGEFVDPERAIDNYDLDDLEAYIQDSNEHVLERFVDGRELKHVNVDHIFSDLLDQGYHTDEILKSIKDLRLLR